MKVEVFDQQEVRHWARLRCREQLPATYPPSDRYMLCKSSARWKIDDIPLCTNHAGRRLLKHCNGRDIPNGKV